MKIEPDQIREWFSNFENTVTQRKSVVIKCPNNECDYTVDTTVMTTGIRKQKVCRNPECSTYKFEVEKNLVEAFHVELEVQNYSKREK